MRRRNAQAGFVVSTELQLVALVLVLGLVAGWVKLRDQSLAEIADSMAAVDAYIQGSAPVWQTGGTRWISGGAIIEPSVTGPVQELWVRAVTHQPGSQFPAPAAEPVPGFPGVYRNTAGFLVYGDAPIEEGQTLFSVTAGHGEERRR